MPSEPPASPVEIRFTPEFKRNLRALSKRFIVIFGPISSQSLSNCRLVTSSATKFLAPATRFTKPAFVTGTRSGARVVGIE